MGGRTRRVVVAALLIAAAVNPVGESATAQTAYQLLVSTAADRSNPDALGGTVSGDVYVFTAPDGGVRRVAFYLDDPAMDGPAYRIERRAPFDLAGSDTAAGTAHPFDTTQLGDGTHNVTAELDLGRRQTAVISIDFVVANSVPVLVLNPNSVTLTTADQVVTAAFTVDVAGSNEPAVFMLSSDTAWLSVDIASGVTPAAVTLTADPAGLPVGSYQGTVTATAAGFVPAVLAVTLAVYQDHALAASNLPDLSAATPLDGASAGGDLYVFLEPDDHVDQVTYYLDDPSRSAAPLAVATTAPFHMMGSGPDGLGLPFDTTQLTDGIHTVTADIARTVGGMQAVTATIDVANTGPRLTFDNPLVSVQLNAGMATTMTVELAASDMTTAAYSSSSDVPWMTITPPTGSTPFVADVIVDAAALVPGTYVGTVTATAPGYGDATLTVDLRVVWADATTSVSIVGGAFYLNGAPANAATAAEGLLLNARMVQAAFDEDTGIADFAYPDTGVWDPQRNLAEMLAFIPVMARHGLDAVTIGMQGGNPWPQQSDTIEHPEVVSAFDATGALRPAWQSRLEAVIEELDRNGMAAIVSMFYRHQADELADEQAVLAAVDNTLAWLVGRGYTNVMVEIANEVGGVYPHAIMRPLRVHELVARASGMGYPVSVSHAANGSKPTDEELAAVDYVTLHGNGLSDTEFADLVASQQARTSKPIIFNESYPVSQLDVALSLGVSWGFQDDDRLNNYVNGFQAVPVNWSINTPSKYAFFAAAAAASASPAVAAADVELTLQATPSQVEPGMEATLVSAVTNGGPDDATVTIQVDLPVGLDYRAHAGSGFDPASGRWSVAVPAAASATLVITVAADSAGAYVIGAETITSSVVDPDSIPGNQQPSEDDSTAVTLTVAVPAVTASPAQISFTVVEGESAAAVVDIAVTTGVASPFGVALDRPVRVMPLGDSVTKGEGDPDLNGYRGALFESLTASGHYVDFVGELQNGTAADPDHEGHEGWRAHIADGRSVWDNVYGWLTATPADIVLLHVGTNDIFDGQPVAEIAAEIEGTLDEIDRWEVDTGNPVHVVMALLINREDPTRPELTTETTALNGLLAGMAAARIAAGDSMTVVDMENALTYPDDLSDGVHPNPGGYAKMAAVWLPAVEDAIGGISFRPSWLTATPASGTTPEQITFTADSSGLPPGTYTAEATVTAGTATPVQLPVVFTITSSAAPAAGIVVSSSPDRSAAELLDGSTVAGDVYIFWSPADGVDAVDFWVDNTRMLGRPDKTERNAPFDLAGGMADGTARPFDVSALGTGVHTVSVRVTATDGSRQNVTATFSVG